MDGKDARKWTLLDEVDGNTRDVTTRTVGPVTAGQASGLERRARHGRPMLWRNKDGRSRFAPGKIGKFPIN